MNLAIHLPEDCPDVRQHCSWHNIDEPEQPGDHRTCGECGHIYRTARDLRWAYIRSVWQDVRRPSPHFDLRDRWEYLIGAVRRPAADQYFCPLCGHDFIGEVR